MVVEVGQKCDCENPYTYREALRDQALREGVPVPVSPMTGFDECMNCTVKRMNSLDFTKLEEILKKIDP